MFIVFSSNSFCEFFLIDVANKHSEFEEIMKDLLVNTCIN